MAHAKGEFWLFCLLDCQKMAFVNLKGKLFLPENMKLTLFKKASKVVHFTDFFEFFLIEKNNNNNIFMVSEIQTIDNGLSQPHFQGFFSAKLF